MHAFRCKNCGRLHAAECAGVNLLPTACEVCGAGVVFAPNGTRTNKPDNWELLADATPERLAELGISADQVAKSEPCKLRDARRNLERCADALAVLAEKEKVWNSKTPEQWQAELDALHQQIDALVSSADDPVAYAKQEHDRLALEQQIKTLTSCEWTKRDDKHRAELQDAVTNEGKPSGRKPKSVLAHGSERVNKSDKT